MFLILKSKMSETFVGLVFRRLIYLHVRLSPPSVKTNLQLRFTAWSQINFTSSSAFLFSVIRSADRVVILRGTGRSEL